MDHTKPSSEEQKSNGTFAHAGSLPRVPLPGLSETSDRFMEWCSPLLTTEERQETQTAIDNFSKPGGLGEKLQGALKSFDEQPGTHSWLDIFWPSRYLGRRDPIALNANFFFLFRPKEQGRNDRAAALIAAGLNYKLALDNETIPAAMNRQTPLCMDQVKYLFSATRIPGVEQDSLHSSFSDETPGPSTARHIAAFYRGHIFALDVVSPDGVPHSLSDIKAGIDAITETQQRGQQVGHLTTMRRAKWAGVRETLLKHSSTNDENLSLIETALFAINLEDLQPSDDLTVCDQLLHGDSGNRWFDKALQLIVFGNGMAGINVEHCSLDGTTILNFVDAILETDPSNIDEQLGAVQQGKLVCKELVFDLDAALQEQIAVAGKGFEVLKTTTATRVFEFSDFGGNQIKKLRMSPDAFAQCAMQLAHFRSKGFIGATYESIATRHYERGRTEAMRTVTPEVQAFVKTMMDESVGAVEKIAAFRTAGDKHVARARDCQQGRAPEQHLWELLNIYNRNPKAFKSGLLSRLFGGGLSQKDMDKALQLYESPGWIKMRSDSLSTSSAPSPNIDYFGFGSTGPGCIGLGYLVRADEINCYLSTAQGEEKALESFMEQWRITLLELAELLKLDPELSES
jgi:carnitine O-acetyltransferase